jgi:clan AA aspartic protease (TIGR02281 family)
MNLALKNYNRFYKLLFLKSKKQHIFKVDTKKHCSKIFGKLLLLCLLVNGQNNICFGQDLSVEKAVSYLEYIVNEDLLEIDNLYGGKKKIDIEAQGNELSFKYIWENSPSVLENEFANSDIDFNKITVNASEVLEVFLNQYKSKFTVSARCRGGSKHCFKLEKQAIKNQFSSEFCDNPTARNHFDYVHMFYVQNPQVQKKAAVALQFIISKLDSVKRLKDDADLEWLFKAASSNRIEIIELTKKNGVSYLTADLGGVEGNLILDSGASDVSISKAFEKRLLERGIISTHHYLKPANYRIADGSIVEKDRFTIPYIQLGEIVIQNVTCSVSKTADVMLLGKSFLDRFKSWKIDNNTNKLILITNN